MPFRFLSFVALTLSLSSPLSAQPAGPASVVAHAANESADFWSGAFFLTPQVPQTVLAKPGTDDAHVIQITCQETLLGADIPEYKLRVDNQDHIARFNGFSALLVEGKEISISLHQDTPTRSCKWQRVANPDALPSTTWAYDPGRQMNMLLFAFEQERRFKLDLFSNSTACDPATAQLFVDGKQITNYGNDPLVLTTGSTFIATGKRAHLRMTGRCQNANTYYGTVSFAP